MPTRFAFPIMHIISGDYLPFTDKFLLGRTFFQPIESLKVKDLYPTGGGPPRIAAHLNDPISRFYAPGIEIFFDGVDAEVSKIYSMFDGFITWISDRLIISGVSTLYSRTHYIVETKTGRVEENEPKTCHESSHKSFDNLKEN